MGVELGRNDTDIAGISWQGKQSSSGSTTVALILEQPSAFC